jgi:hypothetical protein
MSCACHLMKVPAKHEGLKGAGRVVEDRRVSRKRKCAFTKGATCLGRWMRGCLSFDCFGCLIHAVCCRNGPAFFLGCEFTTSKVLQR